MGKYIQTQRRIVLAFHALIVVVAYFWFRGFVLPTTDCHPADQVSAAAICASAQRWYVVGLVVGGLFLVTSLATLWGVWRRQRWVKVCDWIMCGLLSWITIGGLSQTQVPFLFVFLIPIGILIYLSRIG